MGEALENINHETDSFSDEECSALDLPSNYTQTQISMRKYNLQENEYEEDKSQIELDKRSQS